MDMHLPPAHFAARNDSKRDVSDISTHAPCLPFIAGAQQGMWWGLMSKNFPKNFSLRHEKFQKSRNRFLGGTRRYTAQIRPQRPKRRILTSRTTIGPHFYVSFPIRPFAFIGQAGIAPNADISRRMQQPPERGHCGLLDGLFGCRAVFVFCALQLRAHNRKVEVLA